MKVTMSVVIGMLLLVGNMAAPALAEDGDDEGDTLVEFKGGIGAIPITSITGFDPQDPDAQTDPGLVEKNDVRGAPAPGQSWTIKKLDATVTVDGLLTARGKGLVLASGERIGTTIAPNGNPIPAVKAALFCGDPFVVTPSEHTTETVPLNSRGNFRFDAVPFDNLPLPNPCDRPVLLIRSPTPVAHWFAAAIPR